MHVYFSGIGGSGLAAMANLCLDLGYKVSGSDLESNENTTQLLQRGATIFFSQNFQNLDTQHRVRMIDWFVHTPAVRESNPEYQFCLKNNVQITKQNELINFIVKDKGLKLIAVSGTHGKTTTTAMIVWLFKELKKEISWVVGSNINFGNSGSYEKGSEYLVYEADEYDRKLLKLNPDISLIASLDFDHPDTYTDLKDYNQTFAQFLGQTRELVCMWQEDYQKFDVVDIPSTVATIMPDAHSKEVKAEIDKIDLTGGLSRKNSYLATQVLSRILDLDKDKLFQLVAKFPGVQRRMEKLRDGLYSDYAHHTSEIEATLEMATELKRKEGFKKIITVYQPHQNIRQHSMLSKYETCFDLADQVYWLPTYLTRENPDLKVLTPQDIIAQIKHSDKAKVVNLDDNLYNIVKEHLDNHNLVVFLGAGSIDKWFREYFLIN
ncbi:MAG: Mur ligase domain-containing protein [Patescibacteria group bacterium]